MLCGSGKEHGREGKSQGQLAWVWNVIYYQIITSYLQAGDHTLELVPQGESAPCISQGPLPVFSITICSWDCVGSGGKSAECLCICVSV